MSTILYCPECKKELSGNTGGYHCAACSTSYPVIDGIPSFVEDDSFKNNYFTSAYFDNLIETEKKHFWHITKRKLLYRFLKKNIPDFESIGFFELGCGSGYFLDYLMKRGVRIQGGGDLFVESLKIVSGYLKIPLYKIDALRMPFRDEFGIVALLDIIEHIDDDLGVLKEVRGSLRKGGYVLVTVPALEILRRNLDNILRHKRRYTKGLLRDRLIQAGFSNPKVTYFNAYTIPFLLAQRSYEYVRKNSLETDEKKVINKSNTIHSLPNSLFQLAAAIERPFIVQFGIPAGASLMAIAKND